MSTLASTTSFSGHHRGPAVGFFRCRFHTASLTCLPNSATSSSVNRLRARSSSSRLDQAMEEAVVRFSLRGEPFEPVPSLLGDGDRREGHRER